MSITLPPDLQSQVDATLLESYKQGRAVRRTTTLLVAFWLVGFVLLLLASGVSGTAVVAFTVAAAAVSVVWALMSVSASLNGQLDGLAVLITHYAELQRE